MIRAGGLGRWARPTAADYALLASFDSVRERLLDGAPDEKLSRPLAHWVLPTDRRLPGPLLQRRLRELMAVPFASLYGTPGVGRRKFRSLLELLERAAASGTATSLATQETSSTGDNEARDVAYRSVEAGCLCEVTWERICRRIAAQGLLDEPLGRYAPRLSALPRGLWEVPLSHYAGRSLDEIRRLKTHGDKRVSAILEVFCTLARALDEAPPMAELALRPAISIVRTTERWLARCQTTTQVPGREALLEDFIRPWIEQVREDCGEMTAALVVQRLGLAGDGSSVRQAARAWGRTRARMYQMLDEAAQGTRLRWPDGTAALQSLAQHWSDAEGPDHPMVRLFQAAVDVLFPACRRPVREAAMPSKLREHATGGRCVAAGASPPSIGVGPAGRPGSNAL